MSNSPSGFTVFFTWIWRIIRGLYNVCVVLSVLAAFALFGLALHGPPTPPIENNVALVINPAGMVSEAESMVDFDSLEGRSRERSRLPDLVEALDDGAHDSRISLAVLHLDDLEQIGMAQAEEIRHAVARFRQTGKPVYAYGNGYGQNQYLLASAANAISLDPMGQLDITGLSIYENYYKDALDKLGVQVNVFRVGQFKSAVEPFIRNDMSPDARLANQVWIGDLWKRYNAQIAETRKLDGTPASSYVAGLAAGLQKLDGDAATYAKDSGLVDLVETRKEFRARVAQKVGTDDDTGSFRQIDYRDYLRDFHREQHFHPSNKIAVVTVEGEIVDGDSDSSHAGGDTISDMLDDARRDDDVQAVILRVNSPGGSVSASEKIRRAIGALKDDGTPVVVSMSSLAASGGYWISMDADEIWAHESTITGSIGIFGLFPTVDQPLNKLGIHTDGVGTSPLAGALRSDRPMTPELRSIMQSEINFGYHRFITGVSEGRDIPVDQVEKIAEGRVWSGAMGKELGLVDKIGDLRDAEESAANIAGLKPGEYRVEEIKPELGWGQLVSLFYSRISARFGWQGQLHALAQSMPAISPVADAATALRGFNDPRGEYALCDCQLHSGSR